MPLPFRNKLKTMPNNRGQAMRRLQGLLKMFTRKPEIKADYLEFMGKIIEKGHASQVPRVEPHLPLGVPGNYRILQHTIIRSTLSA